MNKRILIIGNSDGLPGVKVDVENYKSFFKSSFGGNWLEYEIIVRLNPLKSDLLTELNKIKSLSLDYLIVIFSGHGGQERETLFELNPSGDTISESNLLNLAKRQLNIYDCCRSYIISNESYLLEASSKYFSTKNTREKYESRILQSIPQQVSLYSCSKGEVSNDTPDGGVYSKYFIESAKNINGEYKLIGDAHTEAYTKTVLNNQKLDTKNHQHPEAILPRCLSYQQLIISINPN